MINSDLSATLDGVAADPAWLAGALAEVAAEPAAIARLFPAVGRHCGRGPLPGPGLAGWTVDDAARVLLLTALPLTGTTLAAEVSALYQYGDAAEKRAVLRALPWLDTGDGAVRDSVTRDGVTQVGAARGGVVPGGVAPGGVAPGGVAPGGVAPGGVAPGGVARDGAARGCEARDGVVDLLHDAIRTNDPRLVAAALGPCAARLSQQMWRQAVLKCVFMEIPLDVVDGLTARADQELARMLADLAAERRAAGRPMPADAAGLLAGLGAGPPPAAWEEPPAAWEEPVAGHDERKTG